MGLAAHLPPGQPDLFTTSSIDEAARTLLAMLPPQFMGAVIIDAQEGEGTRYYSVPGHRVQTMQDLARHLWVEAVKIVGGGYAIRRLDKKIVEQILESDREDAATAHEPKQA